MIADCAIDPEVFAVWQHFQSLSEDFGVSRARLISEFPGKWRKQVVQAARAFAAAKCPDNERKTTDMQATTIARKLSQDRFKRKLKSSGGRPYDPSLPWVDNAQTATPAFDLIIATGSGACGVRIGAEVLLKDEAPFFRSNQRLVRRRKEDLLGAAAHLLTGSDDVIIIDPNFRADEPRFCASLKHLIAVLVAEGRIPKRLEIHTNRIRKQGEAFHRGPHSSQWSTHVVPALPTGWKVTVCYWDQLPSGGKPHARFLLTDAGGLYYDHGIDEGDGETLVTLLEDNVWEQLFGVFNSGSLPHDFDPAQFVLQFTG